MAARSLALTLIDLYTNGDALMNQTHRTFALAGLSVLVLSVLPLGCVGQAPADPDQARATLAMALDAWRDGRTMDQVTNGSPPITVSDPLWKAGVKLSRYKVAETANPTGFDLKIPVELWLEDSNGKARQEKVKYTVSVQPARTVLRSPF
jgi:hypothetical protein